MGNIQGKRPSGGIRRRKEENNIKMDLEEIWFDDLNFHKQRGISWPFECLTPPQEEHCTSTFNSCSTGHQSLSNI